LGTLYVAVPFFHNENIGVYVDAPPPLSFSFQAKQLKRANRDLKVVLMIGTKDQCETYRLKSLEIAPNFHSKATFTCFWIGGFSRALNSQGQQQDTLLQHQSDHRRSNSSSSTCPPRE
jgi:hypothetical protein